MRADQRTAESSWDQDVDVLYDLNDALAVVAAAWGLLDRFDGDDKDDTLNEATHAAFNILTGREG